MPLSAASAGRFGRAVARAVLRQQRGGLAEPEGDGYTVQLVSATSQRQDAGQAAVPTTDKDGAPLELIDRSQRASLTALAQQQTAMPSMTARPASRPGAGRGQADRADAADAVRRSAHAVSAGGRSAACRARRPPNRPQAEGIPLNVHGVWSASAAAEEWLKDGRGRRPSGCPLGRDRRREAETRRPARRAALAIGQVGVAQRRGGRRGRTPAAAVLAFDDEFLYVALSCRKWPQVDYSPHEASRGRTTAICRSTTT